MSYSGANNSRSRHQAPHLLLNNQGILKLQHIRYLGVTFSKNCTFNQDVKETLKKSRHRANLLYRIRGRIRGCDPKTLYHTYKTFIRPVIKYRAPIYATLYPARLQQISACEKNAPQDLSTLRQPPPRNQHSPNPISLQRTPKPLRDPHLKLQQRPRHPNPFHVLQMPVTRRPPPQQNPENSQAQAPPNSSPLTSLHRTTGRPPGACGLDSIDHAVTVEDDETLGTQDIYTGKPF
jgi:hypothetical protein